MGEYFSNEEECQHFTDNSTSFGLSILMSYFVENIRQAKNRAIKNEEGRSNTSFIFNLTLANTEIGRTLWPSSEEDKIIYGNNLRINNFNSDDIHLRLLIIFNNVELGFFKDFNLITLFIFFLFIIKSQVFHFHFLFLHPAGPI